MIEVADNVANTWEQKSVIVWVESIQPLDGTNTSDHFDKEGEAGEEQSVDEQLEVGLDITSVVSVER